MPKRITRRERWRRKTFEKLNPPEVRLFRRAMYDPHFTRSFRAMRSFHKEDFLMWCEAAEQCLDRTEI